METVLNMHIKRKHIKNNVKRSTKYTYEDCNGSTKIAGILLRKWVPRYVRSDGWEKDNPVATLWSIVIIVNNI